MSISWTNFADWQERAHSFESMAAWRGTHENLTVGDMPKRIFIRDVTWNLFDVLGVQPVLGRGLTAADDRYVVERVDLVSYGFFYCKLGGRPEAITPHLPLHQSP